VRFTVSTLVVCLYRGTPLSDEEPPIVGREAVERLVTSAGVDDPEDSRVNCLLEGLRVARDLDDGVLAVLATTSESVAGDREIAGQIEALVGRYDPDSAVVVVDSAEDERLVPLVESRVPVDAVDRVVVRQARDIESTYYLLKQFLGDEELRRTVLVPFGITLIIFPVLLAVFDSVTVSVGAITAVFGVFLLYKGLSIDTLLANFSEGVREALYAGQISLVTYVVAAGLALVGSFAGALSASSLDPGTVGAVVLAVQFIHDSVPWLTGAALIASAGRLIDEFIRNEELGTAYVNLPFVAVAVGLAVRGFSAYFLRLAAVTDPMLFPSVAVGSREIEALTVAPGTHLAVFVLASIAISLIGVRVAAYVSGAEYGKRFGEGT
jgi:putative membrane protein